MKRLSAIMVCLLSLFIGVVFSACDDGYKKLKMEFDSDKQFVQLILDDEYYNSLQEDVDRKVNHAKILTVEFSGIKAKDIGDLDIQVIPSDLATIEEWILVDKELQFSIYAERSGSGDIVVTHLGSGKELTIPLSVEKKAITAYSKNNSLVVNIPDAVEESGETKETINTITINPDNLMNFDPIDATDIVNWEIVGNAIDGVELINDASAKEGVSIKDESVSDPIDKSEDLKKPITQIKVSSNCFVGKFQIKPTLSRSGYEDIALDWVVNVNIVKVLNENNVKMLSNNAIGELEEDTDNPEYKIISGDITLLRNASNYNIADIKLYNEKTDILSNDSGYLNVYNIELEKSSDGCFEATLESNDNGLYISVVSFAYSDKMEWVKIHFTPKNAVGNIENFTIQLNLKMSEVASRIDAFVDNIGVESSATANEFIRTIDVELLDYYAKYNNLGQKFNFNVNRTTTDDSLKEMNVKIDLPLISKNNPVYSAEGVLVDMSGAANHGVAGYLLEFRKGGELMKFTLIDGYLVSERFKYSDNIYVKYVRNNDQTAETIQLKFTVSNSYNGAYGEGVIKNTEKSLDIYVSRSRGVRDVEMTGGYIGASDTEGLTTFGTNTLNSLNIMKDNIYTFNQAVSNNLVSEGKMIYGVSIDDVLSGTELTKAEIMEINFDCYLRKDGNKVENVDIAIFSQILNSITLIENSNFKLSLGDNKTFNMIAIFVKEGTTLENGLYEFVLIQRSGGFEKAFSINLVANVNAENILVSPFNKDEMANSKIVYFGENYDGYYADSYIIPTNYNFNTTISTGKTVDGEFVEDVTYIPYISSVNVEIMSGKFEGENNFAQTNLISGVEYMNYSTSSLGKINLSGLLTSGNFGTIFEGEICYIQVKFIVESIKYTLENNFYVVSNETNKAEKCYYFFIYVPVSTIDFEESLNVYNYDQLGYYNKNQGIKTLTLNLLNINETSQSVFDYVSYSWAMSETLKNTTMVEDKENHSATFTFRNESQYYHRISVNITQFGSKIPVNCDVYIHDLMLTQDIVVRNSIKNVNNSKIIYLNVGDILKFDVEQLGDFSFYGIKYVVCDVAGKVYSDYRVNDNGELINSDGSKVINKATDFKVIIFSKDWLKLDIDSYSYYNLSDLSQYLINYKFANKVEIIDVKVRDGSVAKPFLLTSSDDIKSLVGTSEKDYYYYELINDINMNNSALNLGEFNGNLSSFKDYQLLEKVPADWAENYNNYYTYSQTLGYVKNNFSNPVSFSYRTYFELKQNRFSIYNIRLSTNENYAFIDNLNENSQISFVTFKVNYDIKLQQFNKENLAVIGENNGELYNVCVEYYGIIVVNSATKPINIGGLVAINNGEIVFNDSSSIASKGSLNINNNSKVALNIGGLVGVNVGTIQGVLPSGVKDSIEYTLFYEHQGSMFGGKIVLSCENSASTLGGVVGINNNGKLVNIYATGELIGYNNVGGIIGKNIIDSPLNSSAGEDNANIKHSLSSTIVSGNDNIGGVVGYDIYGVYYHVYYELYNSNSQTTSAISGNSSVGGLVGWTNLGKFKYCYFYSYRWNYSNLSATNVSFSTSEANNQLLDISGLEFNNSEFYNKVADINAKEKVGGLIGYSVSSPLTDEIDNNRVIIDNSSVNAYITGGDETGGLIGYALEYPRWTNGYVVGVVQSSNNYKNINIFEDMGDLGILEASNSAENETYYVVYGKSSSSNNAYLFG
ncbi:MAG: hypothetical protein IJX26_01995, partial [Clostridia bacterium]|nr:hypothetical protein [Clostridia bacterium]